MNAIQRKVVSAVALGLLATLAGTAQAQEVEPSKLKAQAESDFEAVRCRLIGPGGRQDRRAPYHVTVLSGVWDSSRHGVAGVEFDVPMNDGGASIVGSLTGFAARSAPAYDKQADVWRSYEMDGGPAIGVKQRIGRAGLGDVHGNGLFVEPYVAVGVPPIATSREYAGATRKGESRRQSDAIPILAPYVAAGVNLNVGNKAAVGLESRTYTNGANGSHVSFTALTITFLKDLFKDQ
jgi:hypothetical protein